MKKFRAHNRCALSAISAFVLLVHVGLCFQAKSALAHRRLKARALVLRTYYLPPSQETTSPPKRPKAKNAHKRAKRSLPQYRPQHRQQSFQKMRNLLDKVPPFAPTKPQKSLSLEVPHQVGQLAIDQKPLPSSLKDNPLIAHLRRSLQLPDYGDVTVELTISHQKLTHMRIISSASSVNAEYLRRQLPELFFPMVHEEIRCQIFTFCNES